jgi:predicted DNA-binding protein YlxM (UPF0122 family)
MSKLIKPIEYAKSQGISRQAVYAKIKKGLLESKIIDGKIYIVLDTDLPVIPQVGDEGSEDKEVLNSHLVDVKELLNSKEETISVLKESISDLKQTNTEINTTLRGEIELLKQVFTEMRNLYVKQVDYMSIEKSLELENRQYLKVEEPPLEELDEEDSCWITVERFFERFEVLKKKRKKKVLKRLKKAYKEKDSRIKREDGVLFLRCEGLYSDFLKKKSTKKNN